MKVLHAAHLPFWSGGIVQQMLWEQEAANELGLDWRSAVFISSDSDIPMSTDDSVLVRHQSRKRWLDYRRAYYEWLASNAPNFDLVLLRYSNFNPLQFRFLWSSPVPVVLVHHALEVPELKTVPMGRAKALAESVIGPLSLKKVPAIVAVTGEIARYEVARSGRRDLASFLYPNGTKMRMLDSRVERHPVPRFLFVASRFSSWQGLDRLIRTARRSREDFIVDLVGEVEPSDAAECAKDARFVLHGRQNADYINALAERAWLGLSSFALDLVDMEEASTLKVREYLSSGLPVYSGHRDVIPDDFPFYRNGSCEMDQILAFARETIAFSPIEIARLAHPYIEKKSLLKSLHAQLDVHFGFGLGR